MGELGVESNAVAGIKHQRFAADVQFFSARKHIVELLTRVCVGFGDGIVVRFQRHQKRVHDAVGESFGKRFVTVSLRTLHARSLTCAGHIVRTHAWRCAEQQFRHLHTIDGSEILNKTNGNVEITAFVIAISFHFYSTSIRHLFGREFKRIAQAHKPARHLLNIFSFTHKS